jgi:hypothetical protein
VDGVANPSQYPTDGFSSAVSGGMAPPEKIPRPVGRPGPAAFTCPSRLAVAGSTPLPGSARPILPGSEVKVNDLPRIRPDKVEGDVMRRKLAGATARVLVLAAAAAPLGCAEAGRAIVAVAATTTVVAIAVTNVQKARAASLDVDRKQLEIEGLKRNGEATTVTRTVSSDEAKKIRDTRKVKVKLDDGSEVEVPVTLK